jgi:hypothetical protein
MKDDLLLLNLAHSDVIPELFVFLHCLREFDCWYNGRRSRECAQESALKRAALEKTYTPPP